jgi:hypothetical protein
LILSVVENGLAGVDRRGDSRHRFGEVAHGRYPTRECRDSEGRVWLAAGAAANVPLSNSATGGRRR